MLNPGLRDTISASALPTGAATSTNQVLRGYDDSGTIRNVPVTQEGHIETEIHGPLNPFGSVHTENLTPVFQIDAVYGISPTEIDSSTGVGYNANPPTPTTTSGTATNGNNLNTVSTGTTAFSFAQIQSVKRLRYRPGQGAVVRYTAKYSAPAANSYLLAGCGTAESGFYFGYAPESGYTGTTFGILHVTGGVRAIQTLTISAAATGGTVTFRLNGLDYVVTLPSGGGSIARTCYDITQQTFPGYRTMASGTTVIFLADSAGAKAGTFSITRGTEAAIAGTFASTVTGVDSDDTFYPQSAWNGDKCDGTGASGFVLDPTKGNVFQIGITYLGFGPVQFKIEIPSSSGNNSSWIDVNTLNFPNTRTGVTVTQPSFPFTMVAYSAGSTTNVSVSSSSTAGFVEGGKFLTGPRFSYFNTTAVGSSTSAYIPIFTVRNNLTFNGRANQTVINLISTGLSAISNTGITSVFVIKNATLTGNATFATYSTSSCTSTDTTATACTFSDNNQVIFTGTVTKDGYFIFAFSDQILLQPGETVTIAVRSVTATASCVGQLNTREDQ